MPPRTVSNEEIRVTSAPLNTILPRRGGLKPTTDFTSVVLPTPFRPSKPRICPSSSFSDSPCST
jgi:hypothetical protein